MKILQFPAYITIDKNPGVYRCVSGYRHMTLDIVFSVKSKTN